MTLDSGYFCVWDVERERKVRTDQRKRWKGRNEGYGEVSPVGIVSGRANGGFSATKPLEGANTC